MIVPYYYASTHISIAPFCTKNQRVIPNYNQYLEPNTMPDSGQQFPGGAWSDARGMHWFKTVLAFGCIK